MAAGMPLLSAGALPYTTEDLEEAKHTHELQARDFISWNLDAMIMGLGGDNSWAPRVHPEYQIPATAHSFRLRLRAVQSAWRAR